MTLRKSRVLLPTVAAILLFAGQAAAQAPTVTATVNGAAVSVQWTVVPGATAYDVFVTGAFSGSVSVPGSVTSFQVTPPPGTYTLAVRGTAGATVGPLSVPVTFTIGGGSTPPGPCAAPAPPVVTASASGNVVTVTWTAVAGTLGYRVEFSRTPGGIELVQTVGAGQTSLTGAVPMNGTFYVRVIAGNGCGTSTSAEVSFTIGSPTPGPGPAPPPGSGPRTPNPVPGAPGTFFHGGEYLLTVPAYGAAVVNALAAAFPNEVRLARPSECRGGNNLFLFRVLRELRKLDTRWGLNYKRGNFPTLSEDIITWNGSSRPDEGESHIQLFDIAGGACFAAGPNWGDVSAVTWSNRGQPYCGTEWCARWTLAPYLAAGNPEFPQ